MYQIPTPLFLSGAVHLAYTGRHRGIDPKTVLVFLLKWAFPWTVINSESENVPFSPRKPPQCLVIFDAARCHLHSHPLSNRSLTHCVNGGSLQLRNVVQLNLPLFETLWRNIRFSSHGAADVFRTRITACVFFFFSSLAYFSPQLLYSLKPFTCQLLGNLYPRFTKASCMH